MPKPGIYDAVNFQEKTGGLLITLKFARGDVD